MNRKLAIAKALATAEDAAGEWDGHANWEDRPLAERRLLLAVAGAMLTVARVLAGAVKEELEK